MKYLAASTVIPEEEILPSAVVFRAGLRNAFPINEALALLSHCNLRSVKNFSAEEFRKELTAIDLFLAECDYMATAVNSEDLLGSCVHHGFIERPTTIPPGFHIPTFFREDHGTAPEWGNGVAELLEGSRPSSFEMMANHHRARLVESLLDNNHTLAFNVKAKESFPQISLDKMIEQAKQLDAMFADRNVLHYADERKMTYLNVEVHYARTDAGYKYHFIVARLSDTVMDRIFTAYHGRLAASLPELTTPEHRDMVKVHMTAPADLCWVTHVVNRFNYLQNSQGLSILDSIN